MNRRSIPDMSVHRVSEDMTALQVYAKDSFERFGDDLTELIVSYLTLEDKLRFECISKQWQRFVFRSERVLRFGKWCEKIFIARKRINQQKFETYLKKLKNINDIQLIYDIDS